MVARQCAAAMLVSVAWCGALASDEDLSAPAPAPRATVEVEALAPMGMRLTPPSTLASSMSTSGELPPPPGSLDAADALRARWWLRFGAVGIGTGGDWPSRGGMRQVFGLRADLSPGASVIYERLSATSSPLLGLEPGMPGERVALEFKSVDKAAMYRGFVRVQLSSSSTLQLRPRRGGMHVSWRAAF